MAVNTPICDFGWKAPEFTLKDPDGRAFTMSQCVGDRGVLIAFICNHCPYVQAIAERFVVDARELQSEGINVLAVMSNDYSTYTTDSPADMKVFAAKYGFTFPYLVDEDQSVARAYGAVCTPDFFGFNSKLELQYRGRIDESRKETAPEGVRRDLLVAMKQVAATGQGPREQVASMGCSIKWAEGAE
ncbi:MAG: thioredoxin family protein [Sideroxydans sp.]|jgi:peroxiredoxin|nr:thioredoxin family protein [Sideroxydans sp.]